MGEHVPPADSFTIGGRTIDPSETVRGLVAVARGPLEVRGRIEGNALALHGDIIVREGGVIRGDAVAIGGHVHARGGTVEGEIRSVAGLIPFAGQADEGAGARPPSTWEAIKVVFGWLAVLLVIGIGVLIFAEPAFDPVVETLQRRFARAFWYGVLAELAAIPLLLVLLLALALTVVGILLIPFAIVAYILVVDGLLTLGFLAIARVIGRALLRRRVRPGEPERTVTLRAMTAGLVAFFGLWLLAALFARAPVLGLALRALAVVVTWAAATAGFGAAILSRAGTVGVDGALPPASPADELSWQTPTPLTGVAAARRPTPAPPMERI
jgi:hypothetical protein